MILFTISEETEKLVSYPLKRVTLEQVDDDVIVRLDGLAVVAFRAGEGAAAVMPGNFIDKGLRYIEE